MKHRHYFKDVSHLKYIDVYRVLDLWEVADPCVQHAVKKLLNAGKRGSKNFGQDIQEAIDSLERLKEMRAEDANYPQDEGPPDDVAEKPSWADAPVWANWLAQDSSGAWYWSANKPEKATAAWISTFGRAVVALRGNPNCNWRDTLERRP